MVTNSIGSINGWLDKGVDTAALDPYAKSDIGEVVVFVAAADNGLFSSVCGTT